eukprot:gene9982-18605_t
MADNFVFFLETVVRGYHAYLSTYKLTLGEILVITPDPDSVMHDKYVMKYTTMEEEHIVGHIPKHLSRLCFKFIEDGGELDAEVIGKMFNAGNGMGVEVPVESSSVGNKQYLEKFSPKPGYRATSRYFSEDDRALLHARLSKLSAEGVQCPLQWITGPEPPEHIPNPLAPPLIEDLNEHFVTDKTDFVNKVRVTAEQIAWISNATIGKRNNELWGQYRKLRLRPSLKVAFLPHRIKLKRLKKLSVNLMRHKCDL